MVLAEGFNGDFGYSASDQLKHDYILSTKNKGEPTLIFTSHWNLK